MKVRLTARSSNRKTGPIPVSTTHATSCPSACPLKKNGCYASGGPLALVWAKVGEVGVEWTEFCDSVRKFPARQLWRHNQAGDLPGEDNRIDAGQLAALVQANTGRRGFTYTHKPVLPEDGDHWEANREAVQSANQSGFTINLSANSLAHADRLAALGIAPVVSIVPEDTPVRFTTPGGRRGIVCTAQVRDDVSCSTCGICAQQRDVIVGFRPHGNAKKKAERIAQGIIF